MRVVRAGDLPTRSEGVALVRVFMTPDDGLADLTITQVDLEPGSATPEHSHDTDQIVYVLEGEAVFSGEGERHRLAGGDLIYVPAGALHRHECAGEGVLRQLSLFLPVGRATSKAAGVRHRARGTRHRAQGTAE